MKFISLFFGERSLKPFKKCPVCGGELVQKEIEKLLRGGKDTATLKIQAQVCLHCGERLYAQETVRKFEKIRVQLERHQTAGFEPLGRLYQVG